MPDVAYGFVLALCKVGHEVCWWKNLCVLHTAVLWHSVCVLTSHRVMDGFSWNFWQWYNCRQKKNSCVYEVVWEMILDWQNQICLG